MSDYVDERIHETLDVSCVEEMKMTRESAESQLGAISRSLSGGIFTRRSLLKRAGLLGAVSIGASSLLLACGGDDDDDSDATEAPDDQAAEPTATAGDSDEEEPIATEGEEGSGGATEEDAGPTEADTEPTSASGGSGEEPTGTINVAVAANTRTLDPTNTGGVAGRQLGVNFYEALVRFAADSFDVEPAIAESWEISENGLTYTFFIRETGFWDGSPVTPEDVKFTFDRQIDESNPGYEFSLRSGRTDVIASIEVVDEKTVEFVLKEPLTPFIQYLTDRLGYIVKEETALELKADFGLHGMGAGVFQVVEFDQEVRTACTWNPHHWDTARAAELNFVVIKEPQAQIAALLNGEVDALYNPDPDALASLEGESGIEIQRIVGSHNAFLHLNQTFEPFKDVRVRKAIDMAIDKQAMVDELLPGIAVVAKAPLSEAYGPYYLPDFPDPVYDPEQSLALLEEAGYGDGLEVRLNTAGNEPGLVKADDVATVIQSYLSQIGITVEIQVYDVATHLDIAQNQPDTYDMTLESFSSFMGDPDNVLWGVFSSFGIPPDGWNYSRYQNDEVDQLITEARQIQDVDRRVEMYARVQEIAVEEVAHVLINHQIFTMAHRTNLSGFVLHPNLNFIFWDATVEE